MTKQGLFEGSAVISGGLVIVTGLVPELDGNPYQTAVFGLGVVLLLIGVSFHLARQFRNLHQAPDYGLDPGEANALCSLAGRTLANTPKCDPSNAVALGIGLAIKIKVLTHVLWILEWVKSRCALIDGELGKISDLCEPMVLWDDKTRHAGIIQLLQSADRLVESELAEHVGPIEDDLRLVSEIPVMQRHQIFERISGLSGFVADKVRDPLRALDRLLPLDASSTEGTKKQVRDEIEAVRVDLKNQAQEIEQLKKVILKSREKCANSVGKLCP